MKSHALLKKKGSVAFSKKTYTRQVLGRKVSHFLKKCKIYGSDIRDLLHSASEQFRILANCMNTFKCECAALIVNIPFMIANLF